jgi:hypothetical protein
VSVNFGPQPWPVIWTCNVETRSPAVTAYAVDAASSILHDLSGGQFGLTTVKLRPCRADCYTSPWPATWPIWSSSWTSGGWTSPWSDWFALTSCGSCEGTCSCGPLPQVELPVVVNSIVEVRVDGSPLVTGAYRLDGSRFLVRTDGQLWPRCNDLEQDDTHVGTWSVTATYGQPVSTLGQLAVGELACELMRAMDGDDCTLPRYVQQIARQGVTISFPDLTKVIERGRLGLRICDMFIQSTNPQGLARRSQTYRVDGRPARRVT